MARALSEQMLERPNEPVLTKWGARRLEEDPLALEDVVVVVCVRNEAMRLPFFLAHHRRLGAGRFLVVDNCSDDGTAELLDESPDVVRFVAAGSYADSACGVEWTNLITTRFTPNRWVLTLDADELFVFPDYERRSLHELVGYLDATGADALRAPMIDMYGDGPLSQATYYAGENMISIFPYFDMAGYDWATLEGRQYIVRGGPRRRLFWEGWERDHSSPYLMKVPMARWREQPLYRMSTHILDGARCSSNLSGALLHFKLMSDFAECAEEEARRGEHFAEARQYVAYKDGLQANPDLVVKGRVSRRFESSRTLVDSGLIHQPANF